jgi:hypothetical protein
MDGALIGSPCEFSALKSQLAGAVGELHALQSQLRRQQHKVNQLRTKLQSACAHANTVSKRESGHYGERYDECPDCLRTW